MYTVEYYLAIKRDECESVELRGMNMEPVIQSGVSEKEKNKYSILIHIYVEFRCFWTVVLEKTLESPLDCKEIQPVHPKGDQSWVFVERIDAETETLILWPPHAKSWLIVKDPDAGRDWGQEEKGMTEIEMAGWHHRLIGHEFE